MEVRQLKTLSVVAKTLNFTQAAEELNLTQSAVSHQIRSLEDELGVKLFSRDKQKVLLTSQGILMLEYANKILKQIEQMRQEIEDNRDSLKGTLRIVAVLRSLNSPFFKIKGGFESIYNDIDLFFEVLDKTETVFEKVKKGTADVGFTTENENFNGLLAIPCGSFEMMFFVGKDHRFAGRKIIELKDLKDEEWLLFDEESWLRRKIDKIFARNDFQPKKFSESNDGATILLSIADNLKVGFLPKWSVTECIEVGKIFPVKLKNVKTYLPLNIVVAPNNRSKLVSVFIDYILNHQIEGFDIYEKINE